MTEKPSDPANTHANAGELTAFVRASVYALLVARVTGVLRAGGTSEEPFQDGGPGVRENPGCDRGRDGKTRRRRIPPVVAQTPAGNSARRSRDGRWKPRARFRLSDKSNSRQNSRNKKGFYHISTPTYVCEPLRTKVV